MLTYAYAPTAPKAPAVVREHADTYAPAVPDTYANLETYTATQVLATHDHWKARAQHLATYARLEYAAQERTAAGALARTLDGLLADALREAVSEAEPELAASMYADMLSWAVQRIEWYDLARDILAGHHVPCQSKEPAKAYNDWRNYPTWAAYCWLTNDPAAYARALRAAQGTGRVPKPLKLAVEDVRYLIVSERPQAISRPSCAPDHPRWLYKRMLDAALVQVDCEALARALRDDAADIGERP